MGCQWNRSTGKDKRVIIVDPANDKQTAKDRTGQLGKYIEPDFSKIVKACQGTAKYAWSNEKATSKATTNKKSSETKKDDQKTDELLDEFDKKVDKKINAEDVKKKLAKAKKK